MEHAFLPSFVNCAKVDEAELAQSYSFEVKDVEAFRYWQKGAVIC